MIQEAYVSFEVAKLLIEKGFNEPTLAYAYGRDMISYYSRPKVTDHLSIEAGRIPLPTQQMAMRWLREVHNINIDIVPVSVDGEWEYAEYRWWHTWKVKTHEGTDSFSRSSSEKLTYEEAVDRAIWHALKNVVGLPYDKAVLAFQSTYPSD